MTASSSALHDDHREVFHVGPVGAGNTMKAINMMACVNSLAMMEGVASA